MSNYKLNKAAAVYRDDSPTMTDQSQAASTDINIIVTQFLRTGQAPNTAQPLYGDFSQLPTDLRGFIELGRSKQRLRDALPEQLRDIPVDQLLQMTNEQINAKLNPPEEPKPPAPKHNTKDETK